LWRLTPPLRGAGGGAGDGAAGDGDAAAGGGGGGFPGGGFGPATFGAGIPACGADVVDGFGCGSSLLG
jgi:hypothetical protein